MPHVLIVGITESGKTTLAKRLCAKYKARGVKTIVLDPLGDPGWHADLQTPSPEDFLSVVKASRSCAVFVDESGEMIGRYNDEMFWLATRGRHYGHNCHFITQRAAQLNPTVRNQCTQAFIFCVSLSDAKTLADEYNKQEIRQANTLAQFECFHVTRFSPVKRLKITKERT